MALNGGGGAEMTTHGGRGVGKRHGSCVTEEGIMA